MGTQQESRRSVNPILTHACDIFRHDPILGCRRQTADEHLHKKILPFVTQFHPSLPCLKNILMEKWHLIQNQPPLREIYKETPLISYRKGKSLKDMLVKAKL